MGKSALTDALLRSLKGQKGAQKEVWDSKVPGFGVRVSSTGTKSFVVVYRHHGRSRRLTLGRYPALSLGEARTRALTALAATAAGEDPASEKRHARQASDVGDAIAQFIDLHCKRLNKASTAKETERTLRMNFLEPWKAWKLGNVSKRDVVAVLDGIVARGSPGAANRALAAVRKFFNWCVQRGLLETSPCSGVRSPAKFGKRDRVLSDAELGLVITAARYDGYPVSQIVQLLILTAQRRGEVGGMQWGQLHLEDKTWLLAAEVTKTGRAHRVPLSTGALKVIESVQKSDAAWLFPARRGLSGKPYDGYNKAKERLDGVCGFSDWTFHDLRRTAATGMAGLGIAPHVIERVLNHASGTFGGVAGIYNRFEYLDEMRLALEAWSMHVEKICLLGSAMGVSDQISFEL